MEGHSRSVIAFVTVSIMMLAAMVPTVMSVGASEEEDVALATSRAYDNDPDNSEPWGATRFSNAEVMLGSIGVNQTDDHVDWYVISVPEAAVINVSMYLVEYNPFDPAEHDLQLLLGRFVGPEFEIVDEAWSPFRWEAVSYLSTIDQDIYIIVISNLSWDGQPNTSPTNYTLSASIYGPTLLSWDTYAWGYRDRVNSSNADGWAKISPRPAEDEEIEVYLFVPDTAHFDLYVYQVWPHDPGRLMLVNASTFKAGPIWKFVVVGGSEGDFYIKSDGVDGFGTFSMVIKYVGETRDLDNIPPGATEIGDNEPFWSSLDQGRDKYDWYKVYLQAGEGISRLDFKIEEGLWDVYNVSFFDTSKSYIKGFFNTLNGGWPADDNPITPTVTLTDLDASVEGFYYIVISAVDRWNRDMGQPFMPSKCEYTITLTLPNEPPLMGGTIPEVVMDEDTVYDGVDLSDYFSDPDGDDIVYSLGKQTTDLDVDVDTDSGKVSIAPHVNWFGNEKVIFRATDTGPGQKFLETSVNVKVNPVNDPPKLVPGRSITNLTINESEVVFTEAMDTVFTDPDNDQNNPLSFTIKLLSKDLTPTGAKIPLPFFNETADAFEIGPIDFVFGNASFKVTADDSNGSLASDLPSLTFNLSVVHKNHAPVALPPADQPILIDLVEGERNDTFWVHDLVEDKDMSYSGDNLTCTLSGQMKVDAWIEADGTLVFDTAGSEYFPGQNYLENIVLKVEDNEGEFLNILFTVTVQPIDDAPEFRSVVPSEKNVTINEGERMVFKVIVDDDDTLSSNLNFTWSIRKIVQTYANGSFFTYETDYSSADGTARTLKLTVTDGTSTITRKWEVQIVDVNRPPESVVIKNPLNATVVKKGDAVSFVAMATDLDGDELTYIWFDGDTELGRGASFSSKGFTPGFHTVKLTVTDGSDSVNTTVIFEVKKDPGDQGVPGFGTFLFLGAVAVAVVVKAILVGRRRRWAP